MTDPHAAIAKADEEFINSLSSLSSSLMGTNSPFSIQDSDQLSMSDTLFLNNRWYLISNLRPLISQLYVEHGIVQTLIDQPVDDAWRAGYEIKSGQIDTDDVEDLKIFDKRNGVTAAYIQARKWARLYGGAGVMIITDQDPATQLDLKRINKNTPLEFRAVDMWELNFIDSKNQATMDVGGQLGDSTGEFYNYYGVKVHTSRVHEIKGKQAPAYIRPRLRGWGMSELERLVRSLNQYLKNQDVIFSLLDEAKVDVFRMNNFNTALATAGGTEGVSRRIQLANQMKNYNNALVMDVKDEYEQKQVTFAGLAEVLLQIRQGLAADLKMPMTKLFGISSAGFNSGEDDIENYNGMLDSEIREKDQFIIVNILQVACCKLFGGTIDDLMIIPNPLRILNAKEEEEVKDSQFNRTISAFQAGLISAQEAKESMNKDSLLPVEVDETTDALMPLNGDFTVGGGATGEGKDTAKKV